MEYVDPETLNRFFYKNELVLRVSDDDTKGKVRQEFTSRCASAAAAAAPVVAVDVYCCCCCC